jgi:hypothetical protein
MKPGLPGLPTLVVAVPAGRTQRQRGVSDDGRDPRTKPGNTVTC